MKKHNIVALVLLVLSLALFAETKTDWQKANLRGKVKTVTDGYTTINYNPSGYLVSESEGTDSSFAGDTIYEYDSNNRLVTEVSHYQDKTECIRITRTYDAKGLLIKEVKKDEYSSQTFKYEYNARQQLIRQLASCEDGSFTPDMGYSYDAAGNLINEEQYINKEMELCYRTVYTYDKNNKLVEARGYKVRDTEILDEVNKYNAAGWLEEETSYYQDKVYFNKKLTYDQYGNIASETMVDRLDTPPCTYSYEYDSQGNWITKQKYEKGKLKDTDRREIIYY